MTSLLLNRVGYTKSSGNWFGRSVGNVMECTYLTGTQGWRGEARVERRDFGGVGPYSLIPRVGWPGLAQ